MKAYAHGDRGLVRRMPVTILTPINSQRYSRSADHGRGEEGTQRRYPCFPRRVDRACASATQRGLRCAQLTAGGAEKASL